jgi:hypothetical protein
MSRALLRCGYSSAAKIPIDDKDLLDALFPRMNALCSPQIALDELGVISHFAGELVVSGNIKFSSASLAKTMQGASRLSIYAATIGGAIERESTRAAEIGKYREALLWDSFGSEAAETLARRVSLIVRQRANAKGMGITPRFSPGYGDLPLETNKTILQLLDALAIGVESNANGLLLPRKSTTGFIGWIPAHL